jgi:hypothetical protein
VKRFGETDGVDDGIGDGVLDGDAKGVEIAPLRPDGSDKGKVAVIHRVGGSDGKRQTVLRPLRRLRRLHLRQARIGDDANEGRVLADEHRLETPTHFAPQHHLRRVQPFTCRSVASARHQLPCPKVHDVAPRIDDGERRHPNGVADARKGNAQPAY